MSGSNVPGDPPPAGDPWAAFGYLMSGVVFYGGLGFLLSVWLKHDYWIPIGILVGLGLGMFLVFTRYRFRPDEVPPDTAGEPRQTELDLHEPHDEDQHDNAARNTRPDSDRGETA